MVMRCCVAQCKNNSKTPNVSLHNFTKDPQLVDIWIQKIRRDTVLSPQNPRPFKVTKWTKICNVHFKRSDFLIRSERNVLKAKSIPTIFQWTHSSNEEVRDPNAETQIASVAVTDNFSVQQPVERNQHNTELPRKNISDQGSEKSEEVLTMKSERLINEVLPSSSSESAKTNVESTGSLDYKTLLTLYTDLLIEHQQFIDMCKCKKTVTCDKSTNVNFIFKNLPCTQPIFSLEAFKGDDSAIMYYTGFNSYDSLNVSLNMFFDYSRNASRENEYFLVLIKLRLNFGDPQLSNLFNIPVCTVSKIFTDWINLIYAKLDSIDIWPHRDVMLAASSDEFRHNYSNVIGFLDATEISVQASSSQLIQSQTFSHYKHKNTLKGLLAVDSKGSVIFVSKLFTGSVSDNALLEKSGFAKVVQSKLSKGFLLPGDIFLADKGFTTMDLLQPVEIIVPAFTNNMQLSGNEAFRIQKIVNERMYVERAIGRIKKYKILTSEVPLSLMGTFNQIWTVCCLLSNFHYTLRAKKDLECFDDVESNAIL